MNYRRSSHFPDYSGSGFRSTTSVVMGLLAGLIIALLIMTGCVSNPPRESDDLCKIFQEKRGWYKDARAMEKRWSVPLNIPMAIMFQESKFIANAKPPRNYTFFGLIPWGRKSSAYGYSQAIDDTWSSYLKSTQNYSADRNDFTDSINFIGWYLHQTHEKNNVATDDAYRQYLNYHEGWAGYRNKTYKNKSWLIVVAKSVENRSRRYASQYQLCKEELSHGFWFRLFH